MNTKIETQLKAKNTNPTAMRILVFDYLEKQEAAVSVSEIEIAFGLADRITLYRTLKTFEEKGIVHSIQENNTTKYKLCADTCTENTHHDRHLHFYCKICKQTTCKTDFEMPETNNQNFRIDEVRFFAKGICENCLSN
jgi:Fur family transcriptional regulator, ferric uptake regulator